MTTTHIVHEAIADVPLLMYVVHDLLGYDALLDQVNPPHGNWAGLSPGKTMVTWLVHILSEHNHFMSHVQDWVAGLPHLWAGIADGTDVILIPEIPYAVDKVAEAILGRSRTGHGLSIVAIAEGALSQFVRSGASSSTS